MLPSSSPLPLPTVPSLPPPPPPRPYPMAPPHSQRVVPERPSNAMRTGFFRTRPASARARTPIISLCHQPSQYVEFLLTSTWYFSTGYPLLQTSISSGEHQALQALTWAATAAELSGMLVNKMTGRASYLFWGGNVFIAVFITLTLTDTVFPPLSSISSSFPKTQVTTFPYVKGVMQSAINILRLQLD